MFQLSTGCDVLIMELCSGGTLGTMLHEPENAFGLNEEEFLLVLKHVGRFNFNFQVLILCSRFKFFVIVSVACVLFRVDCHTTRFMCLVIV